MLPPFLRILINEPELVAEHISAYSSLIAHDVHLWQTRIQKRVLLKLLMGGSLLLTLLFSGIALMVWGATDSHHWTLIVVPLIPLALTIVVAFLASGNTSRQPFEASRKQFRADLNMFKERT